MIGRYAALHAHTCPHADTGEGWTVLEENDPLARRWTSGEEEPPERIRQLLVCLRCDTAIERTLLVEHTRWTTARGLGLGWPTERVAGCELAVTDAITLWGKPEPTTWQVRRGGLALGLVAVERGPRGGTRFTAAAYTPPREPFHPRFADWGTRGLADTDTRADQPFASRTAAVRWVRAQHPDLA